MNVEVASLSFSSVFAGAGNVNAPRPPEARWRDAIMGSIGFSISVLKLVLAVPNGDEEAPIGGSSLPFPDGSSTEAGVGIWLGLDETSGAGLNMLEPFTTAIPKLPKPRNELGLIGAPGSEAADGTIGMKEDAGVDAGAGTGDDNCGFIGASSFFGFSVIPKPANGGGGASD